MKTFRKTLFWSHLVVGITAGIVVLVMSVTGVLLTYEKQMSYWWETRGFNIAPSTPLPPEDLLSKISAAAGATPTSVTFRSEATAPLSISLPNPGGRGDKTVYVNPYSGEMLGEGNQGMRQFLHHMEDWHRWLALEGGGRDAGRWVTGIGNFLFLFIVVSGLYLWWPRNWSWTQLRSVIWFKRGLPGKARDFNWHNTIGFWCCVPLAIVVASGVVMSFGWANNLVFRAAGENPPPQRRPGPPGNAPTSSTLLSHEGLNALYSRAQQHTTDWRTISVRLPKAEDTTASFAVDAGWGGEPQKRTTLTMERSTGQVVKTEAFSDNSTGRRWRTILRFAHTGEVLGVFGQTLAGIASLGAVFLVYTGLALSWRRYRSWSTRRARPLATNATVMPQISASE